MKNVRGVFVWRLVVLGASLSAAQVAVTTFQNDNYRSGTNPHELILTLNSVSPEHFGRVAVFPITGYVYAQPLYVPRLNISGSLHNVVFVATEHDQVYALDTSSATSCGALTFSRPTCLSRSSALSLPMM